MEIAFLGEDMINLFFENRTIKLQKGTILFGVCYQKAKLQI